MIIIVDCGSQLTQNIARRVRALGVRADIVSNTVTYQEACQHSTREEGHSLEGVILSGGPFSCHQEGSPKFDDAYLSQRDVPVLGICYGMQSICHMLGGEVHSVDDREYGGCNVSVVDRTSRLLKGPEFESDEFEVWMSHGDVVKTLPTSFRAILQTSSSQHYAMIEHVDPDVNIFAVQYHPEVDHTTGGARLLSNFVLDICHAQQSWSPDDIYQQLVNDTRAAIEGKHGIVALSGGVDSTTLAVFLARIAKGQLHPIYIDNGLMRKDETQKVRVIFEQCGLNNVIYVDARERFLTALKGVSDPDEKRRIIGHEFIAVFEAECSKLDSNVTISYLAQGTLYPDVIESVPPPGVTSSKIKRHHNVGGLPDHMRLEVVEPFRLLFKDEVRRLAETQLQMPSEVVWRHPFPGPGLAVRIIGDITADKVALLQKADDIFISALYEFGIYREISQAGVILVNSHSVGVMGDAGTYQQVVSLRAVVTSDFMTADWYYFKKEHLTQISNRIVNQVDGINRVVYDITQKPPGTIEWE